MQFKKSSEMTKVTFGGWPVTGVLARETRLKFATTKSLVRFSKNFKIPELGVLLLF